MEILNFRTRLTYNMLDRTPDYYGHLKVLELKQDTLKFINKLDNVCIMQDHSSESFFYFKNELTSTKINTIRKLTSNTKAIEYEIEGNPTICHKNQKLLTLDIFVNLITFALVSLFKAKKFLAKLKRKLQKV